MTRKGWYKKARTKWARKRLLEFTFGEADPYHGGMYSIGVSFDRNQDDARSRRVCGSWVSAKGQIVGRLYDMAFCKAFWSARHMYLRDLVWTKPKSGVDRWVGTYCMYYTKRNPEVASL